MAGDLSDISQHTPATGGMAIAEQSNDVQILRIESGFATRSRTVLSVLEENQLVHLIKAQIGEGVKLTRSDILRMASDFAVSLKKRETTHGFSRQWYYSFMERWPELQPVLSGTKWN